MTKRAEKQAKRAPLPLLPMLEGGLAEHPPEVTPSAHSDAKPPRGEKSHGVVGRSGG